MLPTWNFALGGQFFQEQHIDLCVLHFDKELHEVIFNNICKIIHLIYIKVIFRPSSILPTGLWQTLLVFSESASPSHCECEMFYRAVKTALKQIAEMSRS